MNASSTKCDLVILMFIILNSVSVFQLDLKNIYKYMYITGIRVHIHGYVCLGINVVYVCFDI